MIQLALFFLAVCLFVYWVLISLCKELNKSRKVLKSWPLIGHAYLLMSGDCRDLWNVLKLMSKICVKRGGVVHESVLTRKVYGITDPDDGMTASNACLEKLWIYNFAKPWLGNGLVTVTDDMLTWKRHRKILNRAFSQQILDGFLEVFNKQSRLLVEDMAAEVGKGPFDHFHYLEHRLLQTICQTAMGIEENEDLLCSTGKYNITEAFQIMFNIIGQRFQNIWMHSQLIYNWTSLKKKQDEVIKELHKMSDAIIQKKKRLKNSTKVSDGQLKPFLDLLLELPAEDAFTDQEIKEEVDTMIVAGYDTSATTLTFLCLMLGSHPDVQSRAFEELREVLGDSDRSVEKQDLSKLIYLEAVIKETMRLYPLVPALPRYVPRDVKLKNHTMPAGAYCFILVYGMHRDPKLWGPDADRFRPDRWLDPATLPDHPAAFSGFGMGKRGCLGKAFAMMSLKTTLAHILREYRLTADHSHLVLQMSLLLKPHSGYEIAIERR